MGQSLLTEYKILWQIAELKKLESSIFFIYMLLNKTSVGIIQIGS